jgi:hypothetical protein
MNAILPGITSKYLATCFMSWDILMSFSHVPIITHSITQVKKEVKITCLVYGEYLNQTSLSTHNVL